MLLPVDRWIVHNTAFLLTLIAYISYTDGYAYQNSSCRKNTYT